MGVFPRLLSKACQPRLRSTIARGWGSVMPGADFNAESGMSISETQRSPRYQVTPAYRTLACRPVQNSRSKAHP